ncbi:MAG: ABC transporter substrate-binding protein [Dehalococcoidia bacterium]
MRFDSLPRPRLWRTLVLGVGALLAFALVACSDDDEPTATSTSEAATSTEAASATAEASSFPLTVVDYGGTEVEIPAQPDAIISYSPGGTEILFAIGAGEQVVAVDRFSDYPPQAASLQGVEYSDPDPEAALSFEPDLVLLTSRQDEQVEVFRNAGLPVVYLGSADSLDEVYDQIEFLGRVTGHEDGAQAVLDDMHARVDAVTGALAEVDAGPRVYFEISADLYSVAPDSFVGGLIEALKGQNVAEGATTQFPQLTAEAVIDADPEVVFLADADFGESLESLRARPGWDAVTAVVDGRVFAVDPDTSNRPGPRLAEAIEAMARAMYPDRFP